jgi:hypothetical protein
LVDLRSGWRGGLIARLRKTFSSDRPDPGGVAPSAASQPDVHGEAAFGAAHEVELRIEAARRRLKAAIPPPPE